MITFNQLGNYGRLGNQMFQYAFLFSLAKQKNYNFCIPPNTDLEKCFNLSCPINYYSPTKKKHEPHFYFDVKFPSDYLDNCNYSGYFQTEKYFKCIKHELINEFKFKEEHKVNNKDYSNIVSIHIRRENYVNNPHHTIADFSYLQFAKSQFTGKTFLIFSDDIEWCKQHNIGDLYSTNTNHYQDLYEMTLCSGSIITNSSFSWWGAYLTPKQKIIAPKKWFSGGLANTNWQDIYCEDWIII